MVHQQLDQQLLERITQHVAVTEQVADEHRDDLCRECREPQQQHGPLAMCLHAARYSSERWSFVAQAPEWAQELFERAR